MKIISFGWTWPPFVAGVKTVTRRGWKLRYAAQWHACDEFLAYDRSPRYGGEVIGRGKLVGRPELTQMRDMPDQDYIAEGFAWLHDHPQCLPRAAREQEWAGCTFAAFDGWRNAGGPIYVIRFEVLEIDPAAQKRLGELLVQSSSTPAMECHRDTYRRIDE